MTENQKQPLNSDEIDLLELLARVVISIKSNIKLIVGAFLVGSLLGLAYYQFVPKSYESRMLVSSEILTESYSKTIAEDLNKLIKERNIESLSAKLNLTPADALALGKLEVKNAIEKADGRKEEEKTYLTITCQASDNSIWPGLQSGLINFFETNDYVKIRVEQRKKYYTQVIEKIDKELVDLNELKSRITNGEITQSSKDNLILFDPTTVNTKILDLNKEKINLQNSLETVNSIQLVEGFTVFEKPVSPKLSISLSAGASFGLFIVALILGFKSLRKIVSLSEEKLAKS
ncbi:MAG TPA: hypothetical protein PKJ83_08025 [Cyclobacteriaceae bacterium]|nr:hypothetical protein [Cyclobacteriaceae bacterium]HPW61501.1 hypothetical protein [Cyclobacteriaceae bacterium]